MAIWLYRSELDLEARNRVLDETASAATAETAEAPETEEESGTDILSVSDEALAETEDDGTKEIGKFIFVLMFVCNLGIALFRYYFYGCETADIITLMLLFGILWPSAWMDYREFRIPNRFIVIGIVLRLFMFAVQFMIAPAGFGYILLRSGVAAVALLLVAFLCRLISPNAIGFGDIKLLFVMGLYLSTDGIGGVMFCCMVVAFVASAVLLITKKANRQTAIPFAPFLAAGTVIASILTNF